MSKYNKSKSFFAVITGGAILSLVLLAGCQQAAHPSAEEQMRANMQEQVDGLQTRLDILSDLITLRNNTDCATASQTGLNMEITKSLQEVQKATNTLQTAVGPAGRSGTTGSAGVVGAPSVGVPGTLGTSGTTGTSGAAGAPGLPGSAGLLGSPSVGGINVNLDATGNVPTNTSGNVPAEVSGTVPTDASNNTSSDTTSGASGNLPAVNSPLNIPQTTLPAVPTIPEQIVVPQVVTPGL